MESQFHVSIQHLTALDIHDSIWYLNNDVKNLIATLSTFMSRIAVNLTFPLIFKHTLIHRRSETNESQTIA